MSKKCYIYAWGDSFSTSTLGFVPEADDFIIAADSGCERLRGYGLCPDVVIGDMDSLDVEKAKAMFPSAEYILLPAEKDYTDTKECLDYAITKGFDDIVIIGGLGGRLDHTLANIHLLAYAAKRKVDLEIVDGKNHATYLKNASATVSKRRGFRYLSIIPLSDELKGVSITGVKYPLDGAVVSRDDAVTVSNEITDSMAVVTIAEGEAVIIESAD